MKEIMRKIDALNFTLTRRMALEKIRDYGFTEIEEIKIFLNFMNKDELDGNDIIFLRKKIGRCLKQHDNESKYFIPLREFASELDCLSRIKPTTSS